MSTPEQHAGEPEQRSSIKVVRNSKGDPQWEVKVVEGADAHELDRIRGLAVAQHNALREEMA